MHGNVFIVAEILRKVNSWGKFVVRKEFPRLEMAEGELAAITYASDDRSSESNLPTNLPLVPVNPSPATGLELGDDREPIGPPCEGSITPVLASPTEEERRDGTDVQVAPMFPTNIGVRVLLKEIKCLTHRAEFLETVVEPLKRQDEAAADESNKPNPESSKQPAQGQGGVDMARELKQSIKESAELIRVINGDFSRLGEKLNEWVPEMYKKVTTIPNKIASYILTYTSATYTHYSHTGMGYICTYI